jgi:type I restriction enzyme S subunit
LGEVCTIITGGEVPENTNKGRLEPSEEYPYAVYTNGKEVYGYTNNYQLDVESVCISSIGANTGAVFYR